MSNGFLTSLRMANGRVAEIVFCAAVFPQGLKPLLQLRFVYGLKPVPFGESCCAVQTRSLHFASLRSG